MYLNLRINCKQPLTPCLEGIILIILLIGVSHTCGQGRHIDLPPRGVWKEKEDLYTRGHIKCSALVCFILAACLVFCGSQARAAMLDLTTVGASGFINSAYFLQIDPQATSSGVINSIVRISADGTEQGYNSDYRPVEFNEHTTATFNRSLLLANAPIINISGVDYR